MVILTPEDKKVLHQINRFLNDDTPDYSTNMLAEETGLPTNQVYNSWAKLKKHREI